ncbi:MAG: cob(I)yrinic acid a,c-diamide adenosyltransferase [Endomicrobiales bacterium]
MICVLTGNGKGKTTSAMGQILRALGRDQKVCLIQLFKGVNFYGEQKILVTLKNLDFHAFAPEHPFCFKNVSTDQVRSQCRQALKIFEKVIHGRKKYGLIVLEEFNIALRDKMITCKDVLTILKECDPTTNVLITGRGAPKELLRCADLITEMKEIKHPYAKGVAARKGWEF